MTNFIRNKRGFEMRGEFDRKTMKITQYENLIVDQSDLYRIQKDLTNPSTKISDAKLHWSTSIPQENITLVMTRDIF